MFMDKNELKNIVTLTKAKLRNNKHGLIWFALVTALLYLIGLITTLGKIFKTTDYVEAYFMQDLSVFYYIIIVITVLTLTITYRQTNDLYSVFPQTNNSRFITTLLYQYFFIIIVAVTFLIQYLLQYSLFKILSRLKDNIILALDFNIGFVFIGFLTFLMYAFITTAIFSLIGAILRKIGYYAILIAVALISIFIVNLNWTIQFFSKLLFFLMKEPNIVLFFTKGILLWVVCTAVALILNKITTYSITKKTISLKLILIYISIVVCVSIISINFISYGITTESSSSTSNSMNEYQAFRMREIVLDVSDLPKGSELQIAYNDNIMKQSNGVIMYSSPMYYSGEDTITIDADKLYVYYRFRINITNGYSMTDYINPIMTATINDNTLYLNYEYTKNIKVVILPAWSMASQFEIYDESVVKEGILSTSSSGSGTIFITSNVLSFE